MASLPCKAADVIPGDVVELTIRVKMKDSRGHYVKGEIRRKRGDRWVSEHGPISRDVRVVGRVVDFGQDKNGHTSILLERTNARDVPSGAVMPGVVDHVTMRSLDWASTKLARRPDLGPAGRSDVAGREYLRQLLVSAVGGGSNDQAAVERLAACVTATAIEAVGKTGALPERIGIVAAKKMLQGVATYSELAYRQLTGRAEIPQATDATGIIEPTDASVIDPKTSLLATMGPHLRVLSVQGPEDPHAAKILAAFPGAIIRTAQLVNWRQARSSVEEEIDQDEEVDDLPEPADAD